MRGWSRWIDNTSEACMTWNWITNFSMFQKHNGKKAYLCCVQYPASWSEVAQSGNVRPRQFWVGWCFLPEIWRTVRTWHREVVRPNTGIFRPKFCDADKISLCQGRPVCYQLHGVGRLVLPPSSAKIKSTNSSRFLDFFPLRHGPNFFFWFIDE